MTALSRLPIMQLFGFNSSGKVHQGTTYERPATRASAHGLGGKGRQVDVSEFRRPLGRHYRSDRDSNGNIQTRTSKSEFFIYSGIDDLNESGQTLGLRKFDTNGGANTLSFPSSSQGVEIQATRRMFRLDDSLCKGKAEAAAGRPRARTVG